MSAERTIFRADQLPTFQNRVFHTREEAVNCPKGDVIIVQDPETGLIFNRAFDPAEMQYDSDYQNEQGVSDVFQRHLEWVADLVHRHFAGLSLIEVGCGKGLFLERLLAAGFDITGMDPTYQGANPAIRRTYFTADAGIRGAGIILRHVLEHILDPVAFLAAIRDANGGGGKIYIEVPCIDWIAAHRSWFDIFYEHVNYFRLADFQRMFGVVHLARHSFNGQYLSVVADLASLRTPVREPGDRFSLPDDFLASVDSHATRLRERAHGQGDRVAIWGAASKGVIFALYMQRAGVAVGAVIDINRAKQGKFLAASGLEVWAPARALDELPAGSDVLVMNGNYLGEIESATGRRYRCTAIDTGAN